MAKIEIAIEIGSNETVIFLKKSGIVLREASLLAFEGDKVLAIGNEAKKILGKTSNGVSFVYPVVSGNIVDEKACTIMVKYFLDKIVETPNPFLTIEALVCHCAGLKPSGKTLFKNVLFSAGVCTVRFVPSVVVIPSAFGYNFNDNEALFVVDVGAGKTDLAIVFRGSVVVGYTINQGGKDVDMALCEYVKKSYNMKISLACCEKLKVDIGSLLSRDISNMEVSGIDAGSLSPTSEVLYATDVKLAGENFYSNILDDIKKVLSCVSEEVMNDIIANGILLSGGASNMLGFKELLKNSLKLEIKTIEDAENAVILGAGQLIANSEVLLKICSEK